MNIYKYLNIKVLAFLSAIILWFFVVGVENYVFVFPQSLEIKVLNLTPGLIVAQKLPTVKVNYKLLEKNLNTPNISDFDLSINTLGLSEGNYQLPVYYSIKNPKINIVSIEPETVTIELVKLASKEVEIKSKVQGKPMLGFEVQKVSLRQNNVKITGLQSNIDKINSLNIDINLEGQEKNDFSKIINLKIPENINLKTEDITFEPNTVQVDVKINKIEEKNNNQNTNDDNVIPDNNNKKTVMVDVVAEDKIKSAVREFVPNNILLTIEGNEEDLKQINGQSFKLKIHEKDIINGFYEIKLSDIISLLDLKIKMLEVSPSKIAVKF